MKQRINEVQCAIPECPNMAKLSDTGRPGYYCSLACKQKAYRLRHKSVTKLSEQSVTKLPDIEFYCGINAQWWAHHLVAPGPLACVAPMYGARKDTKQVNTITVPPEVQAVLVDSAASCL
jgi:hypothetical protein